jgi:MYXO-CTERM domain-containing protein
MKTRLGRFGTGLFVASLLAAASVQATIVLGENGNSSGASGMLYQPSSWDSSVSINTLAYLYPAANGYLTSGWVAIFEPGVPHDATHVSDLIHFYGSTYVNHVVYNQIFFYSNDNNNDLADHMPSVTRVAQIIAAQGTVSITENALGQAFYAAQVVGCGRAIDFEFVSAQTPVPEPTTMVAGAGALGLALLGMGRARRSSVVRIG